MAYGFRCAKCGFQDTSHETTGSDGNQTRISGYHYSLETCTGFKYKKEDEKIAIKAYLFDPIKDFPDYLRKRAEETSRKEWIKRGFVDGLPPINHSVWLILSNGQVVDVGS